MSVEQPPVNDRRLFTIMGVAIAVIVAGTLAAVAAVALARQGDGAVATPAAAGAASTVTRAVDLRSTPASDSAIVTRLLAGTPVRVLGRSPDSAWLVVGLTAASGVVGWVPLDAVSAPGDVARLAVIADARSLAGRPSGPTLTPDLPDLRVELVIVQRNRLVAVIVNDGPGDLPTPILVSVNEGAPVRVETKAGEPLRARQRFDATVPGAYVQLRAPVSVRVLTEPADREEDQQNNRWSGIVEPDLPNDLEILRATRAEGDGHLVVTLRNNSPIPLLGGVTVTVREAPPSTTLLGRVSSEIALDHNATLDLPFADLHGADLLRITVRLSTDAINDAVLANDTFPR